MSDPEPNQGRPRPGVRPWLALLAISGALLSIAILFVPTRVQNAILSALGLIVPGASGLVLCGVAYLSLRQKQRFLAAMYVLAGLALLVVAYDSGLQLSRLFSAG